MNTIIIRSKRDAMQITKETINPLATVELIAPLVEKLHALYGEEELRDEYWDTLCTLHQLILPSTWKPPFTNKEAIESAKGLLK